MNIAIIGSGNVAWHLAKFWNANGHRITGIYSRTAKHAEALAQQVHAPFISSPDELRKIEFDILVLAVSDEAIPHVVNQISRPESAIVVHTSGATPMGELSKFDRYGVIYPPQSLNKTVATDLRLVPFAIEGSDDTTSADLIGFMRAIAPQSFHCNSRQRLALHLAAVFANNFTNALYQIAYEIMAKEGLDFALLHPIILETAQKVQNTPPREVQTGPALRNDIKTINRHLELLTNTPTEEEIYQQLTDFLIKQGQKP